MDPDTSGFIVFVKRLIRGGPAERAACIRPGDLLVSLQDRDVRGHGLARLRDHILGPAGSLARMGFLSADGAFYVCDVVRSAYREAPPPAPAALAQYPPQPLGGNRAYGGAGGAPHQAAPPIQAGTIAVAIRRPDILRPAPQHQQWPAAAASAYASAGSAPRAPQAYGGPAYYAGPASVRPQPAARHVEPWLQPPPPAATRQPLGPGTPPPPRAAPAPQRHGAGERFSPGRRPDEYLDRGYTRCDAQVRSPFPRPSRRCACAERRKRRARGVSPASAARHCDATGLESESAQGV